jgi:hypothetical protein
MKQFLIAAAALVGVSASALDLVRDGKQVAVVVIPAQPLPVESYAAKELQYHIEVSTGARLPIISGDSGLPASPHVYLGRAAASAKIDLTPLAACRT